MVSGVTQTMHRSDQILQATVSDELLFTPRVDSHLSVVVSDGVVTLAGDVASVPERTAAARTAGRVWGVKGVVDEMTVRSAGASGADEDDLAMSAKTMLEWAIDVPVDTVAVAVHDRALTLSGAVTWEFQREAAARAVSYIRGITGVTNDITIIERATVSVSKGAVEAAIRRNTPLVADTIVVNVDGHTLTLAGTVRSATERRQAEHLAWAAAGVSQVQNELTITS
jgi:osmotically-inducible protein OsmY